MKRWGMLAGIHKSKDTRYHTEIIDYYPAMGGFLASKYDGKRRFANYPIRPDGTLGKKSRSERTNEFGLDWDLKG